MLPGRPCVSLSPMGHSRVHVEAKGPHELQQGLTHRHSHLEVSRGEAGEASAVCIPHTWTKGRIPLCQRSPDRRGVCNAWCSFAPTCP